MSGKLGRLCVELSTQHSLAAVDYLEHAKDFITRTARALVVEITQSFNHLPHTYITTYPECPCEQSTSDP